MEITWESLFSVISKILCLVGGIFFIWSYVEIKGGRGWGFEALLPIVFGIFIIIGAISGLKYPIGGNILCLIIGLISPLICWTTPVTPSPIINSYSCIITSLIFLFATIFTIVGSIVGLIGGILKKRKIKKS
jgi:hypothetical protein